MKTKTNMDIFMQHLYESTVFMDTSLAIVSFIFQPIGIFEVFSEQMASSSF